MAYTLDFSNIKVGDSVLRRFEYSYSLTGPLSNRTFSAEDRHLLNRGLLKYTLTGATKQNGGQYTHRDLFVTAVGKRALEAYEASRY